MAAECSVNAVHLRPRHFLNLLAKPRLLEGYSSGCLSGAVAYEVEVAGEDVPRENLAARLRPARGYARYKVKSDTFDLN